jgi:hypothetical protein
MPNPHLSRNSASFAIVGSGADLGAIVGAVVGAMVVCNVRV